MPPRPQPVTLLCTLALAAPGCAPSDGPITWSGTLVDDPLLVGAYEPLPGAEISAWADGAQVAVGSPIEGAAAAFSLTLEADVDLELRVEAEGYTTTVWPTRSPVGPAAWLEGALYPRAEPVLAALRDAHLTDVAVPAEGSTAGLWLEPDPAAPWGSTPIVVSGTGGAALDAAAAQVGLRVTDAGAWVAVDDDLPDVILLLGLPPGPIEVALRGPAGGGGAIPLTLRAGELGVLPRLRPAED